MTKVFNLSCYKELLELEKNKKITFLDLELVTYKASIKCQISYDRKEDYFSLIEKYLRRNITGYEFQSKIWEMENEDSDKASLILKDFQKLKVFTFSDDLENFSDLTDQITTLSLEYNLADVSMSGVWLRTPISDSKKSNRFFLLVTIRYTKS